MDFPIYYLPVERFGSIFDVRHKAEIFEWFVSFVKAGREDDLDELI